MPPYDRQWHYADAHLGTDGAPAITVWFAEGLPQQVIENDMKAGLLLGLAQTGYAGNKWQELYARYAARDAALGPKAVDPFLNRRALAEELLKIYNS
jgi:hypothetical protein